MKKVGISNGEFSRCYIFISRIHHSDLRQFVAQASVASTPERSVSVDGGAQGSQTPPVHQWDVDIAVVHLLDF